MKTWGKMFFGLSALGFLVGCGTPGLPVVGASDGGVDDGGATDGGSQGGVDAGVYDDAGCLVVQPTLTVRYWQNGVVTLGAELGGAATLYLDLNGAQVHAPGTYSLSDGGLPCASACVHALSAATSWRAVLGSVELTVASNPLTPEVTGTLSTVSLREVDGQGELQPNGTCLTSLPTAFDTTVPLGSPCAKATDCGDTEAKSCEPTTLTCSPSCLNTTCPPGTVPFSQMGFGVDSCACYPECTLYASNACGPGAACLEAGLGKGRCVNLGSASTGAACEQSETRSGCASPSEMCAGTCALICDPYASSPGCPSAQRCSHRGYCHPPAGSNHSIPVGSSCSGALEEPCADDGLSYRGVCSKKNASDPLVCRRPCRPGLTDCAPGQTCTAHLWAYVCE